MYFDEFVKKNIYVYDSHDFIELKIPKGHNCFIIGHHIKDKDKIDKASKQLIENGYVDFHIFGEQAPLWKQALDRNTYNNSPIDIEASQVADQEMAYNLALMSEKFPQFMNLVLSDDEYFTAYLVEDFKDILNGQTLFSIHDWEMFKKGFEFQFNNKDCIVSVDKGILIGYLGQEKFYPSICKAFREKIFDGQSFKDIWQDKRMKNKID